MRVLFFACIFIALFASFAAADEEEFTSFFNYLSTFHSYYPNRVPPVPSVTLPTILIVDTDDSSAPFGFITFSREGAIPTFDLPPASYFATSLFGNANGNNGFVVESSEAGDDSSPASTLFVSMFLVGVMMLVSLL